jgi:transcriptional regulator with XRE-family HTH domain
MSRKDAEKRQGEAGGFAERLRALRRQKNLSQSDLGQLVDLHFTHVSRYERGLSRPTADTLKRLADALGVSGDYLLEGATDEAAKARFEDRELLRRFQEVQELPDRDKEIVKELLDAFLTRRQVQQLAVRGASINDGPRIKLFDG